MAGWEGRSAGSNWGYRFFISLLRWGGLRSAYAFLPFVTRYYYWFRPAATRPLFYLYHHRLGLSPAASRRLIRKNLFYFGMSLIDKVAIVSGAGKELEHDNIEGTRHISAMLEKGRGGLVLSAHLGNWEL